MMFDQIIDFFLSKPKRITLLGNALFRVGTALTFLGFVGRIATVGTAALASMGGRVAAD